MSDVTDAFLTGASNASRFSWLSFDVSTAMPTGWREEIEKVARNERITKHLIPPHSTSREASDVTSIQVMTVRGATVWERLPWLTDLYRDYFRVLGLRPEVGRLLTVEDDGTPGGHPVIVLSGAPTGST